MIFSDHPPAIIHPAPRKLAKVTRKLWQPAAPAIIIGFGAAGAPSGGGGGGGGGSFDSDTTAWAAQVVTNLGAAPSTSAKTLADALIVSIKGDPNLGPNLNSVLTRLWLLSNPDNTASATDIQCLTSVVNPGSAIATLGGAFTSKLSGYQSNGTSGYIDTKFNINAESSTDWTNLSAAMGTYCVPGSRASATTSLPAISIGAFGASLGAMSNQLLPYFTSVGAQAIQSGTAFGGALAHSAYGMHMLSRTGSGATQMRQYCSGGPFSMTDTDTGSISYYNMSIYICARNNFDIAAPGADSFLPDKVTIAFLSRGMGTTAMDSLAGYFNTYMAGLSQAQY